MATMKTVWYVVYRHGSNAANQSMTPSMPIGVYEGVGRTADERHSNAIEQAQEEHTVYANQYLNAQPHNRVSPDDYEGAREYQESQQMLREQYR